MNKCDLQHNLTYSGFTEYANCFNSFKKKLHSNFKKLIPTNNTKLEFKKICKFIKSSEFLSQIKFINKFLTFN